VTGELVTVGVGFLTCQKKFAEKFTTALGFLSLPTPPKDPSVDFTAFFLEHGEYGPHIVLNGGLRRTPITLTWNCYRDLLSLCLQHLIEAQLVLCSYCEAIHLGIDVLQELVCGMNLFANFIIYPYLIPNDISERGLISIKILTITTLLAVVERETGLVPPNIEALIRTKTIVGITNDVDIVGDRRVVHTHVACFFTLFTRYSGIDHFEMIEARVLKLLHKKINLGGEHAHLFKPVNLAGAGLSALLIPALVRSHLLKQFTSFLNTKSEDRTSNNNIYI
jgi:hypothetical protein